MANSINYYEYVADMLSNNTTFIPSKASKEEIMNTLRENPELMSTILVELRNEKIKKLIGE